jgi:hypothetical protein
MTKLEAISQLVPQQSNVVTEAAIWLIAASLVIALVWYALIRLDDKRWRRRVNS